jgi:hypothetical protein
MKKILQISFFFFFTVNLLAQFSQQAKLVSTGNIGAAKLGSSVALSADGKVAVITGDEDDSNKGAAWVWRCATCQTNQIGGTWVQEAKLVPTNMIGASRVGVSCSISDDGNTILLGGPIDNSFQGAAWVFVRSGSTWTQQAKLIGSNATGAAQQGSSVSLSADGNVAIVGGQADNSTQGAAWIFVRSGSTWTQDTKIVGTGNTGAARQGWAVAMSGDGFTALVGGYADNSNQGAAWAFRRISPGVWRQEGNKLVGTGNIGAAEQGWSVALSHNGDTALIGGLKDNSNMGAAWVFRRNGSTWTQDGNKLVGSGSIGAAFQGNNVALSSWGNFAVIGGYQDNSTVGAAWVFSRNRAPNSVFVQKAKLVGTGGINLQYQGEVAISNDGGTVLVGAEGDNLTQGAAWIFRDYTVVSVGEPQIINNSVKIYPSITSDNLTIEGAKNLTITNLLGQIVLQKEITSTNVSLQSIPKGIYIVRGDATEGGIFVRKIVKQ